MHESSDLSLLRLKIAGEWNDAGGLPGSVVAGMLLPSFIFRTRRDSGVQPSSAILESAFGPAAISHLCPPVNGVVKNMTPSIEGSRRNRVERPSCDRKLSEMALLPRLYSYVEKRRDGRPKVEHVELLDPIQRR